MSKNNNEISSSHFIATVAVIGAFILMMMGVDGWGWLVFIAFCCL